jgi:hypothetical protein
MWDSWPDLVRDLCLAVAVGVILVPLSLPIAMAVGSLFPIFCSN